MSERSQEAEASPEPTEEELNEILDDLELFLDLEQIETLPLDDGRNGNGADSD